MTNSTPKIHLVFSLNTGCIVNAFHTHKLWISEDPGEFFSISKDLQWLATRRVLTKLRSTHLQSTPPHDNNTASIRNKGTKRIPRVMNN